MKKLIGISIVILLAVLWGADQAQAITGTARAEGIGYSQAEFIISVDSASTDSGVQEIMLFYGKSILTMISEDTLVAITYPDSIAKAVGTFDEGVTYYWYVSVTDSLNTIYIPFDYRTAPYSFTTTDYTQINNLLAGANSYSTAIIESDSILAGLVDSVRLHLDKTTSAATYSASITTVTDPDSFSVTALDEGVTYYYKTIAYIADSAIVDTSSIGTFTTTDLTVGITTISLAFDSIGVIVDTSGIIVDSLIFQNGAGIVTALAETLTTVTGVDTFYVLNTIPGGVYSYRVLAFLPDSSAIETTTTSTYTRPHNSFMEGNIFEWSRNFIKHLTWPFDNTSDKYTTGPIPITSDWVRIHVEIDGEDDVSTGDSIQVFLWSFSFGDSTAIDTIVAMENDTITITPLKYRMTPNTDQGDSSIVWYPAFDWGTHYGVSATMIDTTVNEGLAQGVRTVFVVIEEIPLMSTH